MSRVARPPYLTTPLHETFKPSLHILQKEKKYCLKLVNQCYVIHETHLEINQILHEPITNYFDNVFYRDFWYTLNIN